MNPLSRSTSRTQLELAETTGGAGTPHPVRVLIHLLRGRAIALVLAAFAVFFLPASPAVAQDGNGSNVSAATRQATVATARSVTGADVPAADLVRYVKQELAAARFYRGPIDNRVTREFTLAVEGFQAAAAVPTTGAVDAVTQMRLAKSLRTGDLVGVTAGSAVRAAWVRKLQGTLRRLRLPGGGASVYDGSATGVYGDRTIQAVMLFQACAGLPVDGLYSVQSRQALLGTLARQRRLACTGRAAERSTVAFGNRDIPSADFVRYAKRELAAAGFYRGRIDNSIDRRFTRAVETFQRSTGVAVTGDVDAVTQMFLVRNLEHGDRAPITANWVKTLQTTMGRVRLPSDTSRFYPSGASGMYGSRTLQAVMLFQACAGLPVNGLYSSETRQLLGRALVDSKPLPCIGGPAVEVGSVAPDDATSQIAGLFSSVGKAAGGAVGSWAAGWALTALGLTQSSSAQLDQIESTLQQINQDLQQIDTTLNQILQQLQLQSCESATQVVDDDVAAIKQWADEYNNTILNPQDPVTDLTQLQTFANGVLNGSTNGELESVPTALARIATEMVKPEGTGIVGTCLPVITNQFLAENLTAFYPVDDTVYYNLVYDLMDYYYGYQAEGTALVVEAYHLQACLSENNCQPSGDTTATAPQSVCTEATANPSLELCLEAQTAAQQAYTDLINQFTQAGAPYSNDKVALGWVSSTTPQKTLNETTTLWARDIGDFTNTAVVPGEQPPRQCTLPLSSAAAVPCGRTAGPYDKTFNDQLTYANYPFQDSGDTGLWKVANAAQWNTLLTLWNEKANPTNSEPPPPPPQPDTTGTLGQFLTSIGFANPGNIIVYTGDTANALDPVYNPFNLSSACFVDTAISRTHTEQPFCNNGMVGFQTLMQTETVCPGTEQLNCHVASSWVPAASQNQSFYVGETETHPNPNYPGTYAGYWYIGYPNPDPPGWTIPTGNVTGPFVQFHWPVLDITKLTCTARAAGRVGPGGAYTTCGQDLTLYLESVVPPVELAAKRPQ